MSGNTRAKVKVFRLGELFCGPGGLALGAINASCIEKGQVHRIVHAWASDYDADSCATYRRNICPDSPGSVICSDVRALDLKRLDPIDGFAYGFPCNDFSIVGEKRGINGEFGPLYRYGVNVLDHFRPSFFVAENVEGLSSANDGATFKRILSDLKNSGPGYNITAHMYRFENYGIPQIRHRVILVGIAKNLNRIFRVPAPFTLTNPKSAGEALTTPPIPATATNQERTRQSQAVIARLMHIQPGENAWNSRLPKNLQLNVKNVKMSQIYKRLDPNRPSYTITGSGGGGTHGYHWDEPRALTNRERARIQTFPDDYVFEGAKESVRRQIGMAVSPRMAEIIFRSLLMTLLDQEYPSVTANINSQESLFQIETVHPSVNEALR